MAASLSETTSSTVDDRANILLVDDQPARLLSYETILQDLGQNLVCARSGAEALDQLMKLDFAVVLLDVSMPGMDGFEAASLIHDHPRFERTPIIFVTGVHITELDRLKGYKLGAVDYVSIPVVPEILRSKVAVLVELYFKRRELQRLNQTLRLEHSALKEEQTRELKRLNLDLQRTNHALAQATQALKETDRLKDEFLAMLAHELRNPLAPIRNAIEIMRRVPGLQPQVVGVRDVIDRQTQHLTRLVDDLLDVSRITRGRINLSREPIAVQVIVNRAIETVQPLITSQQHELVVEMPEPALEVEGDLTRLTQVLGNLLHNAAKYTDPGGRIVLSVRRIGHEVQFCVRDTGIGIDPELMPRLFTLFTQIDRSTHRTQGGLGIGLALVRRLVEMHGGCVTARSAGPKCGSEFAVTLPLRPASACGIETQDATQTGQEEERRLRRILLVDDNEDALQTLSAMLEGDGHVVYTAVNGTDALEIAARSRPDVALLDIGMPSLDGYDVARQIRNEAWGKEMVLIALTGWGQPEDRRRTAAAGFDAHLVKPLEPSALAHTLATVRPNEFNESFTVPAPAMRQ